IYNRYLTATVRTRSGLAEVKIPIDGPGAKLKVYVDPNARMARVAGQTPQGAVTGAMGGWRRVKNPARAVTTVPLLEYGQIQKLFEQLEPQAAYNQVPFPNPTSKSVLTHTVTGWEEQNGEGQDVIYPAYRLHARYERDFQVSPGVTETVVFTDYTWIAANPAFMRPLAAFASQPAPDKTFKPGDVIHAEAMDASKTLADLGYDSSLNFVMGGGSAGDYTYSWRLGSADGKEIGNGRTLDYTLTRGDLQDVKGTEAPVNIFLVVTNTATSHSSLSTATNSFKVTAIAPVYLPQVSR
ncbi:MAG: hypothetical protein D6790_11305, partial [Caldilineae bacterium]